MTSAVNNRAPLREAIVTALGFLVLVTLVAVAGSLSASAAGEQYAALEQPSWAPPSWLFGPVWTVLYLMIAAAGWRVWWSAGSWRAVRPEMLVFAAGLVLNALWTPLFFAADARVAALVDIVLLDLVIVATVVIFWRRDRLASTLLAPYLAWTLFATGLNTAIVVLN